MHQHSRRHRIQKLNQSAASPNDNGNKKKGDKTTVICQKDAKDPKKDGNYTGRSTGPSTKTPEQM